MNCVWPRKSHWSHLAADIAPHAVEETDTHWRVPVEAWREIEAGRTPQSRPSLPLAGADPNPDADPIRNRPCCDPPHR